MSNTVNYVYYVTYHTMFAWAPIKEDLQSLVKVQAAIEMFWHNSVLVRII